MEVLVVQLAPPIRTRLQQLADRYVAEHPDNPGVQLAVRAGGRTITVAAGLADAERGARMLASSRMLGGSITKTLVSATALRLAEQGRLSLGDPLSKWRPDVPNAERITVRDLLAHSSGIPDYTEHGWEARVLADPARPFAPGEPVEMAKRVPPVFEPGSKHAYSNTNYQLLGEIVERVGGMPLDESITRNLLKPARLRRSHMDDHGRPMRVDALGYSNFLDPGKPAQAVNERLFMPNGAYRTSTFGDAGLVTTAGDLARWGERLLGTDRVLEPGSLAEMKPDAARAAHGYGLGLFGEFPETGPDGRPRFTAYGHTGWDVGYMSGALYFPDSKVSVAMMQNGEDPRGVMDLLRQAAKVAAAPERAA